MWRRVSGAIVAFGAAAIGAAPVEAQQLQNLSTFERSAQLDELERVASELENASAAARRALEEARAKPDDASRGDESTRIVNGVLTASFPSTGALLKRNEAGVAGSWCTGTLIGCGTFLTAAHCVAGDPKPAMYSVYLMHGGIFEVADIAVHPEYNAQTATADVALIKLRNPVAGIAPAAVNRSRPVPPGTIGTICGFGRSGGRNIDYGLKRAGLVRTAACTGQYSGGEFVCWNFNAPIMQPGENSNTCNADSGGPLFVNFGGTPVVAGITSGGRQASCLTGDHSYDANVQKYWPFIEQVAGSDLANRRCGDIPQIGQEGTAIEAAADVLTPTDPERVYEFTVPPETRLLRVSMNAYDDGDTDYNLFVRPKSSQAPAMSACRQDRPGQYAFCQFEAPRPGPWEARVQRVSGSGPFQVTATTVR